MKKAFLLAVLAITSVGTVLGASSFVQDVFNDLSCRPTLFLMRRFNKSGNGIYTKTVWWGQLPYSVETMMFNETGSEIETLIPLGPFVGNVERLRQEGFGKVLDAKTLSTIEGPEVAVDLCTRCRMVGTLAEIGAMIVCNTKKL